MAVPCNSSIFQTLVDLGSVKVVTLPDLSGFDGFFFTGHGDGNSRNVPTLVKDISGIGQVSCGSSHTVAVSQDGWSVWSFGGGDNGMNKPFGLIFSTLT